MSNLRKRSAADPRRASAVDPGMLAQYRRAARVPIMREHVRAIARLSGEYCALVDTGDDLRAMGAGVELLDVALRLTATPSPTAVDLSYKERFFERFFPGMAESMRHQHAARVAAAALDAERALAARVRRTDAARAETTETTETGGNR